MDEPKHVPYHLQGELEQIAAWFKEEGLAPDSTKEAQLCLLWRAHQRSRSRLSSVTRDLDEQRSQHMAEMAEVRKSLEQIRIFTEHKDVLAQEIQDENDQLKDQLRRLISLQDAQISEVAKMLYQQGLTELIHSSPSEQVAYLLVERASLLETSEGPDRLTDGGGTSSLLGTEEQAMNAIVHQSSHKGAPRHGQSPWKRLFGLHKAAQSKHTFIPAEARHLAGQASRVERECSRLERDLEEGSRRLAMAHNEIRRLTDELESAHLTQRAYEPELQAAQQEVEQLRQEVEKLKKYEIVELRKAKELNDRLDLEIRALRNRVRCQEAEKNSVQQTVLPLRAKVEQLESALQRQQLLAAQARPNRADESAKCHAAEQAQRDHDHENLKVELAIQTRHLLQKEEAVVCLQAEVERLESALQEQRRQADEANDLAKAKASELSQSIETCRELQNKLSGHSKYISEKESEIHSLKHQLDNSQKHLDNLEATISSKQTNHQEPKSSGEREADSLRCDNAHCGVSAPFATEDEVLRKLQPPQDMNTPLRQFLHTAGVCTSEECSDYQEAIKNLIATQEKYETLKTEICETLKCLDKERSKNHEMKEKHKAKLCRAKRRIDDETTWRDEKIKTLERELSLCALSLAKEKELTMSITVENDKLLVERRRLLQQLSEEEHNKKDSSVTASLSKCRVDFLEMENKTLQNKILHMSSQRAVLERSLQSIQSLHLAEELKNLSNPTQLFTSLPVKTSCVLTPEPSEIQGLLDKIQRKRTDVASSPLCLTSGSLPRSAEMGYLNLTSTQTPSDHSAPPAAHSSSDSTCC